MSSNSNRAIFLDDNDPSIRYDGPWSLLETSVGILGTVHELIAPSGTAGLSLNFTGTSIIAYALTVHGNDTAGTVVSHPVQYTANCLVDGSSVSTMSLSEVSAFSTPLCNSTRILAAGIIHTLEIIFAFPSPNPDFGFYLDYLLVTPAQNQALYPQENIIFYAGDPVVQTSFQEANVGWTNRGTWYETSVPGSQFTFQFTGVAILWYGKSSTNPQLSNSTATYTMDGGDPFTFSMVYNTHLPSQPSLFRTQQYPYGNHTLHVVYQGNNGSIPLTLYGLIVQRVATTDAAGVPQTGTTSTSTDTTLPTLSTPVLGPAMSSSLISQSHREGVGAARLGGILGGVIGLLLIVAVVVYFLVFRRRRIPARRVSLAPSDHPNTEELVPDPFPYSGAQTSAERAKTNANETTQIIPVPYDMEELSRAALLARSSPSYPPGARAPQPQMDYDGGLGEHNGSTGISNQSVVYEHSLTTMPGGHYSLSVREEDSGIRVLQSGNNLPPLYTRN
ncbi:hypothetical protein D9619_013320 [Psilocybe cf. subviscida]|uniref:Transmembrane protein n=1 Tax=Psilocybe cf. subviscida TaxID=2480587 RepID=A0A8H5BRV3_9AGAR|nr:hypothetical protein D9619_013320 [Psilocybe cf. subviscida]